MQLAGAQNECLWNNHLKIHKVGNDASRCRDLALVHAVIPALHKLYLQRPHVGAGRVQYGETLVVGVELGPRRQDVPVPAADPRYLVPIYTHSVHTGDLADQKGGATQLDCGVVRHLAVFKHWTVARVEIIIQF